jgi:hypothetical protein
MFQFGAEDPGRRRPARHPPVVVLSGVNDLPGLELEAGLDQEAVRLRPRTSRRLARDLASV